MFNRKKNHDAEKRSLRKGIRSRSWEIACIGMNGGRRHSKLGSRKSKTWSWHQDVGSRETSHWNESLLICRGKDLALAQENHLFRKKFHCPQWGQQNQSHVLLGGVPIILWEQKTPEIVSGLCYRPKFPVNSTCLLANSLTGHFLDSIMNNKNIFMDFWSLMKASRCDLLGRLFSRGIWIREPYIFIKFKHDASSVDEVNWSDLSSDK